MDMYGGADTAVERIVTSSFDLRTPRFRMIAAFVLFLSMTLGLTRAAVSNCTATINSLDDVSGAKDCLTVNINGFTVPAGEGFTLELATGATVNMSTYIPAINCMPLSNYTVGDVLFGNKSWAGPLFTVSE